ncbi:MAG: hypothetical protein K0U49_11650 [Alphaproteobacteria bacterium]|nr:hypothetical protein [Alphaproteobacteria bacterium]
MKTGQELFISNNKGLQFNVLKFWQWSSSDLLGNTLRGQLAEFIVASALNLLDKPRMEWDAYDLETDKGLKIEVKSSAYLQSWHQNELSKIQFRINPTIDWYDNNAEAKRHADIYIFCLLAHKDKETVNPIDLNQWIFYIVPTKILNEKMPQQKTIMLSSLLLLKPIQAEYHQLSEIIYRYDN